MFLLLSILISTSPNGYKLYEKAIKTKAVQDKIKYYKDLENKIFVKADEAASRGEFTIHFCTKENEEAVYLVKAFMRYPGFYASQDALSGHCLYLDWSQE